MEEPKEFERSRSRNSNRFRGIDSTTGTKKQRFTLTLPVMTNQSKEHPLRCRHNACGAQAEQGLANEPMS